MSARIEERGLRIEKAGSMIEERVKITAPYLTRSSIPNPRSCKGFTLLEMIVVISLIAILAGMLLQRVWFYQEMAEKAAMQQVVGALQSALVLQYGHRMTLAMGPAINNIINENPVDWLAQKPNNYAGEFNSVSPSSIEPGNWGFDQKTHELIYVPEHTEHFEPSQDGFNWIRFRTRFAYDPAPGYKDKGVKQQTNVIFSPVEPYQWLIRKN